MSEAIVNFNEVPNLLAPAFKEQLVKVVWDEYSATVTVINKKDKRDLKAYGCISKYKDLSKIDAEKEAWLESAVKKHDNT